MRIEVFSSPQSALEAALAWLLSQLTRGQNGVLAGGETPLPLYRALARLAPHYTGVLLLSDERWLPPSDPGTNLQKVAQALGPLASRLLPFPLGMPPEEARDWMEQRLAPHLPLDFALLGIGEDGHTASLFPGSRALVSSRLVEVVQGSKPPPLRLTLTPQAFRGTREVLFLALGAGKRQALLRLAQGEDLPPLRVAQVAEEARLFTDQEVV
ncbi:6-phosphogluconolactonase [Thermus sp. LT1-2-5]|uniref:6-phosphogluconolactonase n=1 Tax=Thermus sp. LT1-2-5 TaxID=3026935 RepID=UPI0030EA299D